jgi:hypothetical protein
VGDGGARALKDDDGAEPPSRGTSHLDAIRLHRRGRRPDEPREFASFACTGCFQSFPCLSAAEAHMAECPRSDSSAGQVPRPRRCGPDGRIFVKRRNKSTALDEVVPVVYDLTIVSPAAPSFVDKKTDAAWLARVADKVRRYEGPVTQQTAGQTLAIIGGTCYGGLLGTTEALIKEVLSSCPHSCVTFDEVCRRLSSSLVFSSGALLLNAERALGIRHAVSPLQCTQTRIARKGTVGAVVDAIARRC